jgi:hypothetical protein
MPLAIDILKSFNILKNRHGMRGKTECEVSQIAWSSELSLGSQATLHLDGLESLLTSGWIEKPARFRDANSKTNSPKAFRVSRLTLEWITQPIYSSCSQLSG